MPVGRVRLARFARVRLLRHALPISLLILRKKSTVLQSIPPRETSPAAKNEEKRMFSKATNLFKAKIFNLR